MRKTTLCHVLLGMLLAGSARASTTYYVDQNATGPEDGLSWNTAWRNLHPALATAVSGDEIRVADGTYKPEDCPFCGPTSPERETSFLIGRNGVVINGGYRGGGGGGNPNNRGFTTLLSGDIRGDHRHESYHVVTVIGAGVTVSTVFDGFTIAHGSANHLSTNAYQQGGGMYIGGGASPTISNCIFKSNYASERGGALYAIGGSPVIDGCTFGGPNILADPNVAGEDGGGMALSSSSPGVTNCLFEGNAVSRDGGGVWSGEVSHPVFTNCVFRSNTALNDGGGAHVRDGDPDFTVSFTDCSFEQNKANNDNYQGGDGGGAWFEVGMQALEFAIDLRGCTFRQNTGTRGGGAGFDGPRATLTLCSFERNNATSEGGGVWAVTGPDEIRAQGTLPRFNFINALFRENTAQRDGGGLWIDGWAGEPHPVVGFCTFADNQGGLDTGNVYKGGGVFFSDSGPQFTSDILWGNTDGGTSVEEAQVFEGHGQHAEVDPPKYRYNCIEAFSQSGGDNVGNINNDPTFLDPAGQSPDPADNYWLTTGSPCIDAGDSTNLPSSVTVDLADKLRRYDDPCIGNVGTGSPIYVDMGAYEFDPCVGVAEACDPLNLIDCDPVGGAPPNGLIDACEIAADPGLDQDVNGILDDCQPQIAHGAKVTSFEAHAFGGYIDPRQESTDGTSLDLGIGEVTVVFTEPVYSQINPPPSLDISDFVLTVTGGNSPTITKVTTSDNMTVVLSLSDPIPVQQWTTIEANVKSIATKRSIVQLPNNGGNSGKGVDEPDRIDIGFLPCDVNQNMTVDPFDLLIFRQYVNDVIDPPKGVETDYIDTNRSGAMDPFDLLVFRQLTNGVSPPATKVWMNEFISLRP